MEDRQITFYEGSQTSQPSVLPNIWVVTLKMLHQTSLWLLKADC